MDFAHWASQVHQGNFQLESLHSCDSFRLLIEFYFHTSQDVQAGVCKVGHLAVSVPTSNSYVWF